MRIFSSLIIPASILFASASVVSGECSDSPLEFAYGKRGNYATCEDIGGELPKRKVCEKSYVATHCPVACDKCEELNCVDSQAVFYVKNDLPRYCGWLDFLSDESKEKRCNNGYISRTCPQTCNLCTSLINFDEVEVPDIQDYEFHEETEMIFYHVEVYNATLMEDYYEELPFSEVAVSEPNAALTYSDESAFACLGGSMDVLSMHAAVFDLSKINHSVNSTEVLFTAVNLVQGFPMPVGNYTVEFSGEEVIHVEFPSDIFSDIAAVIIQSPEEYLMLGFDDLEVDIKSPCDNDFYNDYRQGEVATLESFFGNKGG